MLYKKNQTSSLDPKLFQNPTSEYRGTPFWAWNCKVSKEDVDRTLNALKKMGMGGAHIHSRTGMDLPYLGKEFMEMVHYSHEKSNELGGLASVISKIPDKKRLADFPNYMIHRASKLHNLFVFKNTAATVDMVKALNPDIIVNATGSVPTLPPITGLHDLVDKDGTNVATVLKMIERINEYPEDMKGQKIAIIGGGAVGLDVMEFFTERGSDVTMVEMLPMIGNGLDPVTKCDTNAKMAKYNVKQMTNTALQEVQNDRFIVKNPQGEIEEIPFDYGFICLGMRANNPVLDQLEEAFADTNVEIINIGDSKRARRIIEGTEEGRNILNVLAKHDYL